MAWLEDDSAAMTLVIGEQRVAVERLAAEALPRRFGYVPTPGM